MKSGSYGLADQFTFLNIFYNIYLELCASPANRSIGSGSQ